MTWRAEPFPISRTMPAMRPSTSASRNSCASGANPPFDHPHVFLDMGADDEQGLPLLLDALPFRPGLEGRRNPPRRLPLSSKRPRSLPGISASRQQVPSDSELRGPPPHPCMAVPADPPPGRGEIRSRIIVAGAGIAGLTAALAFAQGPRGAALRAGARTRGSRRRPAALAQRDADSRSARRPAGPVRRRGAPDGRGAARRGKPRRAGARAARRFRRAALEGALSRAPPRRSARARSRRGRRRARKSDLATGAAVRDAALHARGVTRLGRDDSGGTRLGRRTAAGRGRRRLVDAARPCGAGATKPLLRRRRLAPYGRRRQPGGRALDPWARPAW